MFRVETVHIGGREAISVEVKLPKTTLLVVTTKIGYIMCGALDVELLNTKLEHRQIIAGRALGVRTIKDLLQAPLESVTRQAKAIGINAGMRGEDAISRMLDYEQSEGS